MRIIKNLGQIMAVAIFLALYITPAHSEGVRMFDIEYLPKTGEYESAIGAGYYQLNESAFGFYGNFQVTIKNNEPMYENLTVSSFGDPVTQRTKELLIGNIGITRGFTPNIGMYAGIGYASATGIAQKHDPVFILAPDGLYYVKDPSNDKSGVNLNAGIILSIKSVAFNAGYHSFTKSAYFGELNRVRLD